MCEITFFLGTGDRGQGTGDKGQGTRDKGQGTGDKGARGGGRWVGCDDEVFGAIFVLGSKNNPLHKTILVFLLLGLIGFPLFAQKNEVSGGISLLWETHSPLGSLVDQHSEYHIGLQPTVSYTRKLSPKLRASISTGPTFFTGIGQNPQIEKVKNISMVKLRLGAGYEIVNNSKAIFIIGVGAESHLMKRKVDEIHTGLASNTTRVLFGYGAGIFFQITMKKLIVPPLSYNYQNIGGHHFHAIGIKVKKKEF